MSILRFLADENLHGALFKGLLKAVPDLDIVRAQDVGLEGTPDPDILQWAADEGRIVITHDVQTFIGFAYERVESGLPMPGVIEVRPGTVSMGELLEELLYCVKAGRTSDFAAQVVYVPMR